MAFQVGWQSIEPAFLIKDKSITWTGKVELR